MLKPLSHSVVVAVGVGLMVSMMPANASQPVSRSADLAAPTATVAKAQAKPGTSKRVIVTPKAGAKVTKHALRIKVRAKHGIVRAKLNKVTLRRSDFVWRKGPFYTLAAASSHGLKHKKNTLTVVVGNGKAGLKKQRVEFRVKHKKPLTGAGRDVTIRAGSTIVVPGKVRLHPDVKKAKVTAAPANATMTWSVVRAPGKDPVLEPNSQDTLELSTERPGRYVLKAVGTYGGVRTTDQVSVDATAAPMLELDTFAKAGSGPGIRVGDTVYPAYGPADKAQWQVLILNRHTGAVAPGFNFTYGVCADNPQAICRWNEGGTANRAPQEDLADLDSTKMVIAAHHSSFGSFGNPATYFANIGVPKGFNPSGPTALFGLPGWDPGQAWRAVNSQRGLKGALQWDTNENFTFVSGDRTPFDTRAGGGCGPDTCTVTMNVGGQTRTYSVPKTGGGFAVQAYDRDSLAFLSGQSFDLVSGNGQNVYDNVTAMINYIKLDPEGRPGHGRLARGTGPAADGTTRFEVQVHAQLLAFLVLFRRPGHSGRSGDETSGRDHRRPGRHPSCLPAVDATAGDNYSLVGWTGLGETQGSEVHSTVGRVSGALRPRQRQRL